MIYVTGDCHGEFQKFGAERFPEGKQLTKADTVIICGDFGGIWCGEQEYVKKKAEDYWLRWLDEKPFTTVFVDGNHENHIRLQNYPVTEWHGGRVHQIRDSVLHLMRGEIFEIEGKRFFAFGGARSHDISDGIIDGAEPDWQRQAYLLELAGKQMYRVKGVSWWEEELPTDEEMENGLENLAKCRNRVDYIITHCAANAIQNRISDGFAADRLTDYFDRIRETVSYQRWFFGHYHDDAEITAQDILLYHSIRQLAEGDAL